MATFSFIRKNKRVGLGSARPVIHQFPDIPAQFDVQDAVGFEQTFFYGG